MPTGRADRLGPRVAAAHAEELRRRGFRLHEAFRPGVPAGERGWDAAGELDLAALRALRPDA